MAASIDEFVVQGSFYELTCCFPCVCDTLGWDACARKPCDVQK